LQRRVGIHVGRRHALQDDIEERLEIDCRDRQIGRRNPLPASREDCREIERRIVGVQFDEEIEHQVQDFRGAGVGAIDLVDDDDRPQLALEGFAQDEARLRQRPLGGVHEQEAAIGHLQDALDLAAEIGVARRVDDVDLHAGDGQGDVLGEDGDAALAFEIVGIEDEPVLSTGEAIQLLGAEESRLAHHHIDERGLAMIDVCDDGNIT
jgi:hypothetical protein